jgi:hypothetical protein
MFLKFMQKIGAVLLVFVVCSGHSFSQNFSNTSNSYVGVKFSSLERDVIQAYRNAGFLFSEERVVDNLSTLLTFSFPITGDGKEGVVYRVYFFTQLTPDGLCTRCNMFESYDPYQKLPQLGVSAIPDRLTLESRFSAARTRAFELLKDSTLRYLRPGTDFVIPPKPVPLGSPIPAPSPPVVT